MWTLKATFTAESVTDKRRCQPCQAALGWILIYLNEIEFLRPEKPIRVRVRAESGLLVNGLVFIQRCSTCWYPKWFTVTVTRLPIRSHTWSHQSHALGATDGSLSFSGTLRHTACSRDWTANRSSSQKTLANYWATAAPLKAILKISCNVDGVLFFMSLFFD